MTFVAYWLVVASLALAALVRPAAALAAIICLFGLKQWGQASDSFLAGHPTLTNYLMAGILGLALLRTLVTGRWSLRLKDYPGVGWFTIALHAFALASVCWAVEPEWTIAAWRALWPYTLVIVLATPLLLQRFSDLRSGLIATLAIGSLIVILLLFTVQWSDRSIRLLEPVYFGGKKVDVGNPLATGQLAGVVALIACLMNFRGAARMWQVLRWVLVAAALAVCVRSGSRGQLFAALIMAVLFLPFSRGVRTWRGWTGIVAGFVLLAVTASVLFDQFADTRRFDVATMTSQVQGGRVEPALRLLGHWLSHPAYFVTGLGNSVSFDPSILGIYCHVMPVEVLAEEGLIGFALLLGIIILGTRSMLRGMRAAGTSPELRGIIASYASLFYYELLLSCKQGALLGPGYAFAFAIMLGRAGQLLEENAAQTLLYPVEEDGWSRAALPLGQEELAASY